MSLISEKNSYDSPLGGLVLLVVGLMGLDAIGVLNVDVNRVLSFLKANEYLISLTTGLSVSIFVNLIFLSSLLRRLTNTSRTGDRLRRLAKAESIFQQVSFTKLIIFVICFSFSYWILDKYQILFFMHDLRFLLGDYPVMEVASVSAAANVAVLFVIPVWKLIGKHSFGSTVLPTIKVSPDTIALGSISEGLSETRWETVGKRSLNANILISGSIGSGKSQSSLLPFLQQIASNFEVRPSFLVIDPKRSITTEVEGILKDAFKGSRK